MERPDLTAHPVRPADGSDPKAREAMDALWAAMANAGTRDEFAHAWLGLQCRLLGGVRAGLLLLDPAGDGAFAPAASWPSGRPPSRGLVEGASRVLEERRAMTAARGEPAGADPATLEGSLVGAPILKGKALRGAIVLEVTPRPQHELDAVKDELHWGLGWLDGWLRREARSGEDRARSQIEIALDVLAAALEHDRFRAAATALSTELATQLRCDRVSVGMMRGRQIQVAALSHGTQLGQRTNLLRAIESAMGETLDQEQSLTLPPVAGRAPRGTQAHSELARQFGAVSICTVPLVVGGRAQGAITFERHHDEPFAPETLHLCEAVAALIGPPLELLRRDDRWIVAKIGDALRGGLGKLIGPHHVAAKLAVGVLAALVVFLVLAKGEFRVTADTRLEPAILRAAVAPFDGFIASAPARPGDVVSEGTVLGHLDDRDLILEREKWSSETEQLAKKYRQALADREATEAAVLRASIQEARAELGRIEERLERTQLRAPFDGVVVTGDLSQELGAPVERGRVLYEVAPLDAYRVVLEVDERDIDHIALGQSGTLVLASLPSAPVEFHVEKITPVASAEEGKNTFRVEATLLDPPDLLRPGLEGVAKIGVDHRRLFWIWTHDIVDWVRLTFWEWTP